MNRYEFVMTLTPEEFLTFMTTPKCSSVCEHNANGERWKTKCRGEFLESGCDACKRDFWLKEDVGDKVIDQAPKRGICSRIIMDIIQMSEDLDYESGDYDLDMLNEAKREALNDVLSIIDKRVTESEAIK